VYIANVRIHVERVIGTMRQKCNILQGTLPIIESVDSISRDGLNMPYMWYVHYKKVSNSEQLKV
jgi:hypothetical protein